MAMNMSMTLSVFIMGVVAATVTGFTDLQVPNLSRMERNEPLDCCNMKTCCVRSMYECLQRHPGNENNMVSSCYHEAGDICGSYNEIVGCCYGYRTCILRHVNPMRIHRAHDVCKHTDCYSPCE
uniref:G002_VD_Con-ikot-ikot_precursor_conopeptide n=1 Tax=Conus geographus TaxID=6491 RepID=X5IXX2_CONGE|nr:G002_VD_Con-ikot-ikot_precursor_conopeptide [Conus geographus]